MNVDNEFQTSRQCLLSVLAKSTRQSIEVLWKPLAIVVDYRCLKKPEIGMAMVRAAADKNDVFNMGEMTISRCVIQLESGEIGVGYCAGREKNKAELIAIIDACFQIPEWYKTIEEKIKAPLQYQIDQKHKRDHAMVKPSTVNFFTMVRGE